MIQKLKKHSLFFICLITVLLLSEYCLAANQITNQQMVTANGNGLIAGMCYVYNLITGTVGRIIAVGFVIGIGWGFILGEIKDYKPIVTFAIAIALVFGGVSVANVISGNEYSCAKLSEASQIENSTLYNTGTCMIIDIPEYFPGQSWGKCKNKDDYSCTCLDSNNNDFCNITNNTYINAGYIVAITKCGIYNYSYYLKPNDNISNRWKCNSDGKWTKYGSWKYNDNNKIWEQIDENNHNDSGTCKKACYASDANIKTALNICDTTINNTVCASISSDESYEKNENYSQNENASWKVKCNDDYYYECTEDGSPVDTANTNIRLYCGYEGVFRITGNRCCVKKCLLSKTDINAKLATYNASIKKNENVKYETNYLLGTSWKVECNSGYHEYAGNEPVDTANTNIRLYCDYDNTNHKGEFKITGNECRRNECLLSKTDINAKLATYNASIKNENVKYETNYPAGTSWKVKCNSGYHECYKNGSPVPLHGENIKLYCDYDNTNHKGEFKITGNKCCGNK